MKARISVSKICFALIPMFTTSCLENNGIEPELIIDPVENLLGAWQEADRKVGENEPEPIGEGRILKLWSYDSEDAAIIRAHYEYNPENLGVAADSVGNIHMESGVLSFINLIDGVQDTVAKVIYSFDGDKLTLRDTTETPIVEINYTKLNQ